MTVKSVNDKIIRLPNERWIHIVEGHPEMAGHLNDVLFTIAAPEKILAGSYDELLAIAFVNLTRLIVVVYKETENDGFIITAYFTTKVDKLLKRKVLWQK